METKASQRYDTLKIPTPSENIAQDDTSLRQSRQITPRHSRFFTSTQLIRLTKEFEDSPYLGGGRQESLAHELGLDESQVRNWFSNKRRGIPTVSSQRVKEAKISLSASTRMRTGKKLLRLSSEELSRLKQEFDTNRYPHEDRIKGLADELGLKKIKVRHWFNNQRQNVRRSSIKGDKQAQKTLSGELDASIGVGEQDTIKSASGVIDSKAPEMNDQGDSKLEGSQEEHVSEKMDSFKCFTPDQVAAKTSGRNRMQARRDLKAAENLSGSLGAILDAVKKHGSAWPFLTPVDGNVVADYYDLVKYPMGQNCDLAPLLI